MILFKINDEYVSAPSAEVARRKYKGVIKTFKNCGILWTKYIKNE